ncbi:hypothetical protein BV25DRAFT_1002230 [Artomyces pyxidatus]|uniref:Uncharacterized protein n=1 Tax=Artomyces pyxidatus TaxID=48021 RepID=A0ACB8SUT1_9AGAM|nr:hypothetical protein BV25DRAFT_1002230 [Artomyces pyxidatus]
MIITVAARGSGGRWVALALVSGSPLLRLSPRLVRSSELNPTRPSHLQVERTLSPLFGSFSLFSAASKLPVRSPDLRCAQLPIATHPQAYFSSRSAIAFRAGSQQSGPGGRKLLGSSIIGTYTIFTVSRTQARIVTGGS